MTAKEKFLKTGEVEFKKVIKFGRRKVEFGIIVFRSNDKVKIESYGFNQRFTNSEYKKAFESAKDALYKEAFKLYDEVA